MIPDLLSHDLIEALRPALPLIDISDTGSTSSTPTATSDLADRLVPGQQVTAHVLSGLPGGRFQVQLMGQSLDLNLPPSTLPGQSVELTYLGDQPRLTFTLSAQIAQLAAAPEVSISQAARLLTHLGQAAAVAETAAPVESPTAQRPLLAGPPAAPAQAATELAAGLAKSGLFYEAHQAQWLMGLRSLDALRQEPQAALHLAPPTLPPAGAALAGAPAASPPPAPPGSAATPAVAQSATLAAAAALPPAQTGPALQAAALPGAPVLPPNDAAMAALRAQMQMLDSGVLHWAGAVWPGQEMDWQIAPDDQTDSAGSATRRWRTRLALTLPQLGPVTAWLTLAADGALDVVCETGSGWTAGALRAATPGLAGQLAAAGLSLTALTVKNG